MTLRQDRRGWLTATTLGIGALGIGALATPGAARAQACPEDTLDRIKSSGVFNLGVRESAPPYGWQDASGHYTGFATDIARAIHAAVEKELATAIRLNPVPVTGQTRIPLLQNGTIDMEAGATVITQARTKVVDFVLPHFLTSTEILVPADSAIRSIADLAGKRVGIPQGGLEEAAYRALNAGKKLAAPVRTIGFPDHPQGFTALQTGSVDAYSSDGPILAGLATDIAQWRIFDPGLNTFLQAFPMRPQSSRLRRIADVTVAGLCASGEWQRLYDIYFGAKSATPFPQTDALRMLAVMNAWPAQ